MPWKMMLLTTWMWRRGMKMTGRLFKPHLKSCRRRAFFVSAVVPILCNWCALFFGYLSSKICLQVLKDFEKQIPMVRSAVNCVKSILEEHASTPGRTAKFLQAQAGLGMEPKQLCRIGQTRYKTFWGALCARPSFFQVEQHSGCMENSIAIETGVDCFGNCDGHPMAKSGESDHNM